MELEKRDEADEQKTYELVREAECKLAQIIVQARIPFNRNATTKSNTWFNIEIPDIDEVSSKLVTWRNQALVPLHVLIFVVEPAEDGSEGSEKRLLLEHWRIRLTPLEPSLGTDSSFTSGLPPTSGGIAARRDSTARVRDPAAVHKRIVVLTRAIYSYVRIMPGYRVYKERIRNKSAGLQTDFRFTFNPGADLLEELEQTPTINFDFGDIETKVGTLSASVTYRSKYLLKARPALMQLNVVEDYTPMSPTRSGAVAIPTSSSAGKTGTFSPASAPTRRATVSAQTAPQIARTYSAEQQPISSPAATTTIGSVPESRPYQEISFGTPKTTAVPPPTSHRQRSQTVGAYAAPSSAGSNDPLFAPFTLNRDTIASPPARAPFDFINTLASPPVPAAFPHMSPNLALGGEELPSRPTGVQPHYGYPYSSGASPSSAGTGGSPSPFTGREIPLSASPSSASPSPSPSASSSFEHVFRPFKQRTGALKRPSSAERPASIISPFRDVPPTSTVAPSTSVPSPSSTLSELNKVPGSSPPFPGPFTNESPPPGLPKRPSISSGTNPLTAAGATTPSSSSVMAGASALGTSSSMSNLRRNDSDSLLFKADDILLDDHDDLPPLGAFDTATSPVLALAASRNPELNEIEQFLIQLDQLPPFPVQAQPLPNLLLELEETHMKWRTAQGPK
eukprot:TRINITY_DN8179_c0_g1_i1.p1 TRINITY_DN8179_c0_g1~~TRINITY_DN8179_c0_g1_i1.p1  ORF type:complete len:678 (+),score=96.70 TRINITY_DN8179_c0_g1_i1:347-2380(+)